VAGALVGDADDELVALDLRVVGVRLPICASLCDAGNECARTPRRLLPDGDRALDDRHVAVDARAAGDVAVRGASPTAPECRRSGGTSRTPARCRRASSNAVLALRAAAELRVVVARLHVAGHARVALLEVVTTLDGHHADAGLGDRARRVAADAVLAAELARREARLLVDERESVRVLHVFRVVRGWHVAQKLLFITASSFARRSAPPRAPDEPCGPPEVHDTTPAAATASAATAIRGVNASRGLRGPA
jgi:hypothetical protein